MSRSLTIEWWVETSLATVAFAEPLYLSGEEFARVERREDLQVALGIRGSEATAGQRVADARERAAATGEKTMTEKYPTALLRVEWPAGKRLIVTHITAMDEDGRPVTLKVLSVTPEPPPISKNPESLAARIRRRPARPLTQIEPISPRRKCRCMARRLH
jgi:hypothetical protein